MLLLYENIPDNRIRCTMELIYYYIIEKSGPLPVFFVNKFYITCTYGFIYLFLVSKTRSGCQHTQKNIGRIMYWLL